MDSVQILLLSYQQKKVTRSDLSEYIKYERSGKQRIDDLQGNIDWIYILWLYAILKDEAKLQILQPVQKIKK